MIFDIRYDNFSHKINFNNLIKEILYFYKYYLLFHVHNINQYFIV